MKKLVQLLPFISVLSVFSIQATSDLTHVQYKQAEQFFKQEQLLKAKSLFMEILTENKNSVASIVYMARIAAKQNNFDDAEYYIEKALKLAPRDAFVQNLSGKIYGSIAQKASLFSALGYAKKSLTGFEMAVEINPENITYQQALLSFYLGAPSIAGGDEKLAMEHAKVINTLDNKQGYIAIGEVLNAIEDQKELTKHLANTPAEIQNDPEVLLSQGFIYQKQKDYQQAFTHFKQAVDNSINVTDEKGVAIKFQAMYQLGKTSDISAQELEHGVVALTTFIEKAPTGNQLASKDWAKFRLANLIAKQGNKIQAKNLYQSIAKNTDDKQLKKKIKALL